MIDIRMEKISALALFSSLLGLALVYFAATNLEPLAMGIGQITSDHDGKVVEVSGFVASAYSSQDTLFLEISDGKDKISVVIFSSLSNQLEQAGIAISKDSKITVRGVVQEYKNRLEIVPGKISDIIMLV